MPPSFPRLWMCFPLQHLGPMRSCSFGQTAASRGQKEWEVCWPWSSPESVTCTGVLVLVRNCCLHGPAVNLFTEISTTIVLRGEREMSCMAGDELRGIRPLSSCSYPLNDPTAPEWELGHCEKSSGKRQAAARLRWTHCEVSCPKSGFLWVKKMMWPDIVKRFTCPGGNVKISGIHSMCCLKKVVSSFHLEATTLLA